MDIYNERYFFLTRCRRKRERERKQRLSLKRFVIKASPQLIIQVFAGELVEEVEVGRGRRRGREKERGQERKINKSWIGSIFNSISILYCQSERVEIRCCCCFCKFETNVRCSLPLSVSVDNTKRRWRPECLCVCVWGGCKNERTRRFQKVRAVVTSRSLPSSSPASSHSYMI